MNKITASTVSDFKELLNNNLYSSALKDIGIFEKDITNETGFIGTLWDTWGFEESELAGNQWLDLVHPDDLDLVLMEKDAVNKGDSNTFHCEYRIFTKNAGCRWVLNRGMIIERDKKGHPVRFLGVNIDITSQKKYLEFLEKAKSEAEQKAQEAETLRTAGSVIASSLDLEEAVNLVLEQALQVVPYETSAVFVLEGTSLELVGFRSLIPGQEVPAGRYQLKNAELHRGVIHQASPVKLNHRNDPLPEFGFSTNHPPYTWMGIPLHLHSEVVGIFTFISKHEFNTKHMRLATAFADHVSVALNNARLHQGTLQLATIDPLTNTCTRRWFFKQAESIFRQSILKKQDLAVLMVDIDHFKKINDTYGHSAGDSILHRVCEACLLSLRTTDVMGRYGGEEFAIILPESSRAEAVLVAGRLRENIEEMELTEIQQKVTVSIGICVRREHKSLTDMIHEADTELYRAKNSGRDTACADGAVITFLKGAEPNINCEGQKKTGKQKH